MKVRAQVKIQVHTTAMLAFLMIALISFYAFSKLFDETLIFYLGVPFALSTFLFSSVLLRGSYKEWAFKIANAQIPKIFLGTLTILSVLAVLFVPAYYGSMLEWNKISLLNWLRYLSSLLLTSFLPGYFFLKIIDRKGAITSSIVIVLSYLLSLFVTFLVGFFLLLSANPISSLGLQMAIITNLVLMIIYYFTGRKKTGSYLLTVNWLELGLILSILTAITVGSVIIMINNTPLTSGDMRTHYGTGLEYSKSFPVYGGKLITYPGGYLFHIYLGVLFALSGIPSALAEQGLYILSFMPILAFYSSIKVWFNGNQGKKMASKATMLSVLLGLGGLYALCLKSTDPAYGIVQLLGSTTSKTYDIYLRVLYLPDIVAPMWNIGLPVFFILLCFLRKEASNLTKATIISTLVALGYLGHASEIFLFTFTLFIYTLFLRRSNEKKIGPYVVLGLVIVTLIDLAAPAQLYIFLSSSTGKVLSLPFFISLFLAILTSVTELVKDRRTIHFSMEIKNSLLERLETSWRYSRWILLYTYIFFFIVWLTIEKDFNLLEWGGTYFTPFFVFPLRVGAVGLLAIISIFIYFGKIIQDRRLLFFLLLIPLGFILEQTANYYPVYYPAYRYATLTFVGACIIATYGITRALEKVDKATSRSTKRKITVCALLNIIMISGLLSTTLYYVNASYYSTYNKISQDELDALHYIRQNIITNASVLTFTEESACRLKNFAGINPVQDAQRWSKLLLSISNPYIITYILSSSNVKYIYVAQRDIELLNSNNILRSFVKSFSKVLENDYVAVYAVPLLTSPSPRASVGVLHLSPSLQKSEGAIWIDDSFTERWYPFRQYGEVKNYTSKVSNGLMEISVTSNQSGNIWASYALSGLSLNTSIYPTLSFRYSVANNLTWFTFQLWNSTNQVFLHVGHLSATDFTKKVLTLPENQTVTRIETIVETIKDAPADTTAHAYIDYIKVSSQVISWKDDTFSRDWAFYGKYGDVYDWSKDSDGDILKINVISNQSGVVWVSYSLPLAQETKDSILSFRYKVDNDYTRFTIILQNTSHRFFFCKGHLTDKTFTTKSYLLPNDQIITKVEIIVETTDKAPPLTSATAQIDYIEILQNPFSEADVFPSLFASLLHSNYSSIYVDASLMGNLDAYISRFTSIMLSSDPQNPVESLVNWVSAGNTLIVLNTRGGGFFADLLGITSSSPTLLTKESGLGKIMYVNSLPAVESGNKSKLLQPDFLAEIREGLALDEHDHRVKLLPVYNSNFGIIEVRGDLDVFTDVLVLQGPMNLISSSFLFEKSTEIKMYGKVHLVLSNTTLFIFPSESYMLIKPSSYAKGRILIDDSEAVIVADVNFTYKPDVPVSIEFNASSLSLYARLPSINASGTITFNELDVHVDLYVPLAGIVQQKAEIQGNVEFGTTYISNPLILFSKFECEGQILNLAERASRPDIPWNQVLTSPYNLAFNTIFFLGIVLYIVRKRKTGHTTTSKKIE